MIQGGCSLGLSTRAQQAAGQDKTGQVRAGHCCLAAGDCDSVVVLFLVVLCKPCKQWLNLQLIDGNAEDESSTGENSAGALESGMLGCLRWLVWLHCHCSSGKLSRDYLYTATVIATHRQLPMMQWNSTEQKAGGHPL